jgi:hypothetical protein
MAGKSWAAAHAAWERLRSAAGAGGTPGAGTTGAPGAGAADALVAECGALLQALKRRVRRCGAIGRGGRGQCCARQAGAGRRPAALSAVPRGRAATHKQPPPGPCPPRPSPSPPTPRASLRWRPPAASSRARSTPPPPRCGAAWARRLAAAAAAAPAAGACCSGFSRAAQSRTRRARRCRRGVARGAGTRGWQAHASPGAAP